MYKTTKYLQLIYSVIITAITTIFGEHWILFFIYLILNIIDMITGWVKARLNNCECSSKGMIGIIRKLCCWLIIFIAFLIPQGFQEIGKIIHLDLSVTMMLGWLVLASLIINEYRSILENLIKAGCNIPEVLVKGLKAASKKIESVSNEDE